MIRIITSKRLKELENDSSMLFALKHKIDDVKNWCAYDSPAIGLAMIHLQDLYLKKFTISVSTFRDKIRKGISFDDFKKSDD